MSKSITVKKSDQLFIAIAQQNLHTYVMVGVKTEVDIHLLARVGKKIDRRAQKTFSWLKYIPWSLQPNNAGFLDDELLPGVRLSTLSYSAYDLSYQQYWNFLTSWQVSQKPGRSIHCFIPSVQTADTITLTYSQLPLFIPKESDKDFIDRMQHLNIFTNSCRTSAIEITEHTLGYHGDTSTVSDYFFSKLALHVTKNSKYFYILPPVPHAFTGISRRVLAIIYHRMHELIKTQPEASTTYQKFSALKELYLQLTVNPKLNTDDFFKIIDCWQIENKQRISGLRQTYFFDFFMHRSSATEQMFAEIHALNPK